MPYNRSTVLAAVLVACLAAIAGAGVVGGQVTLGEPDLNIYLPENEVTAGSETELTFQIENDAEVEAGTQTEAVTTARAVRVRVTDDGPFDVKTRETPIGPIADGAITPAQFRMTVPEDVEPGTHRIDVRVRYAVTNRIAQTAPPQRLTRTERKTLSVRVVEEPRFEITGVDTDVQPGTTGEAEVRIANTGSESANATRTTLAGGSGITIEDGAAELFLGDIAPGQTRTERVDVSVAESITGGDRPIEGSFEYRDSDGIERQSAPVQGSLAPLDAQSFSIESLEDTLSVGYDGHVRGTIRNDGPREISDGVLLIDPVSDSLFVEEGRYALSELADGETEAFEFPTDVSGQATPGPRQVRFSVEYSNDGRTTTTVGPVSERVVVDQRRGEFSLSAEETRVTAGESTTLVFSVTNERPETLSNIDARLYTDSPLSSASDTGFIDELEPGESGELRFDLSASGGAMAKSYPVELDFQYDSERGESSLSRTYQQAVEVEEPVDDGDDLPVGAIAGLVLVVVVLVGGVWWWRYR